MGGGGGTFKTLLPSVVLYSRPPPLTCFSSIGTPPSANNFLFADSVVPIGKNTLREEVYYDKQPYS